MAPQITVFSMTSGAQGCCLSKRRAVPTDDGFAEAPGAGWTLSTLHGRPPSAIRASRI